MMRRNEEGSGGFNSLHPPDPAIASIPGIVALPQGRWKASRGNKSFLLRVWDLALRKQDQAIT